MRWFFVTLAICAYTMAGVHIIETFHPEAFEAYATLLSDIRDYLL
jgi:hypothetical protein